MNIQDRYAICYPQIKHPLISEKNDLKKKYISLLKVYLDKYCSNRQLALYRLKTFSMALFGTADLSDVLIPEANTTKIFGAIAKTRFSPLLFCTTKKTDVTPFRLFSYRYLFLFDCIFILAVNNEAIGMKICNELKRSINSRYYNTIDTMLYKMYRGESDFAYKKLITDEMVTEWNRTRTFIKSKNRNITFTATMSAGKSTLINAIIGKELSYAKMAACTSTIMKFKTSPSQGTLCSVFYDGQMMEFQAEGEVHEFTKGLEKPCDINSFFLSPLSSQKITLIDTPGVNSSQNPKHKEITKTELAGDSTDILVYVIPVENYGSEGDFDHLSYIRKNVHYNRIVFVVNMMDTCDFEDDSVSEIVGNIKEHLINIGFKEPLVCPMSAKAGMMIKQALYGSELSENDKKACLTYVRLFQSEKLALGSLYPSVERVCAKNSVNWLSNTFDEVWSAYISTGLPGFETMLLNLTKEV